MILRLLFLAGLSVAFGGCTTNGMSEVEYRINETGTINGADESSCVVRYKDTPPGLFYDCYDRPGKPKRVWQAVTINEDGHIRRIFQEVHTAP
jgi:hypothetical protein